MYGRIHAKSEYSSGTGKTMYIWNDADNLNFSIIPDKKTLRIEATCTEIIGTHDDVIKRSFLLEFDKEEVE